MRSVSAWAWWLVFPFALCSVAGLLALASVGGQRLLLLACAVTAELLALTAVLVITDGFRRRPVPHVGRQLGSAEAIWTVVRTMVVITAGNLLADALVGSPVRLPIHVSAQLSVLIGVMAVWIMVETIVRRRRTVRSGHRRASKS